MEVANIRPYVTLPYSGNCFGISVITREEKELPKPECDNLKKRAIILDSENYKMLKTTTLKNCQLYECKQIEGALDQLFLTIDEILQKVPTP